MLKNDDFSSEIFIMYHIVPNSTIGTRGDENIRRKTGRINGSRTQMTSGRRRVNYVYSIG